LLSGADISDKAHSQSEFPTGLVDKNQDILSILNRSITSCQAEWKPKIKN